jgi:hypothetical protein
MMYYFAYLYMREHQPQIECSGLTFLIDNIV